MRVREGDRCALVAPAVGEGLGHRARLGEELGELVKVRVRVRVRVRGRVRIR